MTGYFWWKEKIFKDFGHAYKVELVFEEKNLQKIQIFKNSFWGYIFVLDGIVQFTERDEFIYHESIVYLPTSLLNSSPEKVLIIGGGDGGVLRELQKIPSIKEILQFEIDVLVFEISQKYFFKLSGNYKDPKVSFIIKDGLEGLKECNSEQFDLIIVDCTDPIGPAKTLYTLDFYKYALKALKWDGIFIQQVSLPIYFPNIIKNSYPLIKSIFPEVKIARVFVPSYGEEIAFFIGAKKPKDWLKPKQTFKGKFYYPELNPYYFSIPNTWIQIISNFQEV